MGIAMAANSFSYVLVLITLSATGVTSSSVPAIFGFGDSTIDVGNNNHFSEDVGKANFKPYGIDYPNSQPTGRFSNGYTIIDFIAQYVGFKESPPAYLAQANNKNVALKGANFASAGSGILSSTRTKFSMATQIQHFESYRAKMVAQLGEAKTMRVLDYSLFIISTGGSDVFNFYKKLPFKSDPFNFYKKLPYLNDPFMEQNLFIETVALDYKEHVTKLYNLGARKFVIFNVGMLGCYPFSRSLYPHGECIDDLNRLAYSLNRAISSVLSELSSKLDWMYFSYGRTYELMSILAERRPHKLEVKSTCCGEKKEKCSPGTAICEQRNKYMFWDMLHLTEKVAKVAALLFFNGSTYYTSPITIKGLVELY